MENGHFIFPWSADDKHLSMIAVSASVPIYSRGVTNLKAE
jgi:hypothetical protein